jgi:hypothetical protein
MLNLSKSAGKTALQQGLIFGVILAALIITLNSIVSLTGFSAQLTLTLNRSGQMSANQAAQMASFLVSAPAYVLSVVIYFIVGWRVSRLAGKASTGALAGLWTGLTMSVLVGLIDIAFLFLVTLPAVTREYSADHMPINSSYPASLVRSTLTGTIVGLLLSLALGAAIGALGGLLGKDQDGKIDGVQNAESRPSETRSTTTNRAR